MTARAPRSSPSRCSSAILQITGDVTSASEGALMAACGLAAANAATAVVLDFSKLEYMNSDGIAPGEVALLDIPPVPGSPIMLSTGVMVLYADDESFTFMTPEGHTLSAWITFSSFRDGDVTIAQAQALERTSDPLDELAYILGANRMNDRFWRQTMENLARHVGVATPLVETQIVCVDKHRQWKQARNIRNSAVLRTARHTLTAPIRWITRRG